jgi:hypothetical protein
MRVNLNENKARADHYADQHGTDARNLGIHQSRACSLDTNRRIEAASINSQCPVRGKFCHARSRGPRAAGTVEFGTPLGYSVTGRHAP